MTWWEWYLVLTIGPFAWLSANLALGIILSQFINGSGALDDLG